MSRRTVLTPSGSGSPVSSSHHSPRSRHFFEPFVAIRQLAFVDHRPARARPAATSGWISSNGSTRCANSPPSASFSTRNAGRKPPGDDDLGLAQLVECQRFLRDDDRPVAGTDRRAVREQRVPLVHERVGRERHRRHLEPPLERPLVQRLDVVDRRLELEALRVDRSRRSPQNMNASSGSALKPTRISMGAEVSGLPCVCVAGAADRVIQHYLRAIYKLGLAGETASVTALGASAGSLAGLRERDGEEAHPRFRAGRACAVRRDHVDARPRARRARGDPPTTACSSSTSRRPSASASTTCTTKPTGSSMRSPKSSRSGSNKALGYPTHDPHWDPIPDANLEWPARSKR